MTTQLSNDSSLDSVLRQVLLLEQSRRTARRRFDWFGFDCPYREEHGPRGHIEGKCVHAREKQFPPVGEWQIWFVKAGRGWGKTRVGAEMVREWSESFPRIGIIGATLDDTRDIMVEGVSGILSCFPPERPARYIANRRRIDFPSGAIGSMFTADEPDRLRGPQHHKLWADEIASWRYVEDAWNMAMLGLRLGDEPQAVITGTPRPIALVKRLRDRSLLADDPEGRVVVTEGATRENSGNLAATFISKLLQRYAGTRLGRQELEAEILEDVPGALWRRDMIEYRVPPRIVRHGAVEGDYKRVVVAIDPAASFGEDADETGIIVDAIGVDGHGYTLADLSCRLPPTSEGWAGRAVRAFHDFNADCIVAEANQGGEMVRTVLATVDRNVPVRLVHASKGKVTRAEPVASLYIPNPNRHLRWFHSEPFPELEDQMTSYTGESGERSPDRMDAHVWGVTELVLAPSWGSGSDVAVA